MTPDAFASLLRKGLGRAVVYLQSHDAAPFRDVIIHACTHDLRYDRQCESGRAVYLYDIIHAAGDPAPYRDAILEALPHPADDSAEGQMLEVACLFALYGDAEAQQAMYDTFERNAANNHSDGAEQIIRMDGMDGLRHVIRRLPEILEDEEDLDPEWWVDALEEQDGKEKAWAALESAAETEPEIAQLLAAVRRIRKEWERDREIRRPLQTPSYDELLRLVALGRKSSRMAWTWGRRAGDEDLLRAAEELQDEMDPDRLITFLRVFRFRLFPLIHTRLLELARSDDRDVAGAAMEALRNIEHPSVRGLALEMLQGSGWRERIASMRNSGQVIRLLEKNLLPKDYRLLDSLAGETDPDPDTYHWLAMGIQDVLGANVIPEATAIHMKIYENTPCSSCRGGSVEALVETGALPDDIREECLWDANPSTRKAASGDNSAVG